MILSFHFKYNHAKDIITIKKEKIKREKEEEGLKYFERYNVEKYYNKEESQHFSFNVFENFLYNKKKNFSAHKNLKKRYL